jgi:hypothetical protein
MESSSHHQEITVKIRTPKDVFIFRRRARISNRNLSITVLGFKIQIPEWNQDIEMESLMLIFGIWYGAVCERINGTIRNHDLKPAIVSLNAEDFDTVELVLEIERNTSLDKNNKREWSFNLKIKSKWEFTYLNPEENIRFTISGRDSGPSLTCVRKHM